MTSAIPRPDVEGVLRELKDFQRDTAQYAFDRLYTAPNLTHRFLVADEVGLGKTHVAKGVIALAVDKLWDTTPRIDVIYICSNAAIARQNINKLNVVPGNQEMNLASRITMLPVQVKDLGSRKLNFVSFTPATSFDLRSSLGMMDERAVLFRLVEKVWGVKGAAAKNALQGDAGTERFRDLIDYRYPASSVDDGIAAKFATALAARIVAGEPIAGMADIRTRWDQLCGLFARDAQRRNRPSETLRLQVEVIGTLRDILATTCLQALQPDLIILDEFQRFKHLMDETSEESRLARDLFDYVEGDAHARVLLLSATPYKMFTGSDEAGGEDHYDDFLATLRFLQKDPARTERCKAVLSEFRRQMLRSQPGEGAPLVALKEELQAELRRVMVRTERLAATPDRDGMLIQVPIAPLSVTAAEAGSYRGLGQIARMLDQGDPVEFWKSAPFLLSFMEDYKLKELFRDLEEDPEEARKVAQLIGACSQLAFPWADYLAYQKLDPGNARMRWLLERFIDSGAWRLLWVPPARPWYQLEGPYAEAQFAGFTKLLIFSSWNVVPKAIAALTSYAAEREMSVLEDAAAQNTEEVRSKFRPLLRFGKESGASLMALVYPSFALARMGAETERDAGGGLPRLDDLLGVLEGRIRSALGRFPDPADGREDEKWYWAAPALLDLREDKAATDQWFEHADLRRKKGSEEEEEEGEAADIFVDKHIPELHAVVEQEGKSLGKRPKDLCRRLAELALAGPAVATLRALTNLYGHRVERTDAGIRVLAGQVAYGFRSYFNLPEVTSLIRALHPLGDYWTQVLTYCVRSGLGAVVEEYAHALHEWLGVKGHQKELVGDQVAEAMIEALTIRTANPGVDEVTPAADGSGFTIQNHRMRSRFAARLSEDRFEGGKERTRTDTLRKAFNSPFWPFVMATTSVGQEGLDFHLYCHAVAHWNLPGNPVDLEQREGRVHRFKCHAVRKNVAAAHWDVANVSLGQDPWEAMFAAAVAARPAGVSDLWPYWIYPVEGGARIERHVPMLPLSREQGRYTRLRRSVTLYRMVFGQPRQEDLLHFLMSNFTAEEAAAQAESLRLDLTPPTRQP